MLTNVRNKMTRTSIRENRKLLHCLILVTLISIAWICLNLNFKQPMTYFPKPFHIFNRIEYFMTQTLLEPTKHICENGPKVIILVESNVHHVRKRQVIRNLLPLDDLVNKKIIRIFLVGNNTRNSPMFQHRTLQEHNSYGDILQGTFEEDYRNRAYKTLMGMRWATLCSNASYIVKLKESYKINVPQTFRFLTNLEKAKKFNVIVGHKIVDKIPVRDPKLANSNPDYVSWDEYSGLFFPTHVSGTFYVTTRQVAIKLTNEAPFHKYLFLEDVFLTGVLTKTLHIPIMDFTEIGPTLFP